jgi:hypothetical protein
LLEILLGHGNTDSTKYKIIIRFLNLISNKENRKKLYRKMGALYRARSAIVHGSDRQPAFECINILEEYEYIIRTAITEFIDTMQSLKLNYGELIDKLDHDRPGISKIDTSKISWNE